jgi:hypothetical protein
MGDGEIRGTGAYTLLPPSKHPSGFIYRWLIPLTANVPIVSPDVFLADERTKSAQTVGSKANTSDSSHTLHVSQAVISAVIQRTLPTGPGQRNRRVFDLACELKRLIPNASQAQLQTILRQWHEAALPFITTKPFGPTLIDFAIAWQNVETSLGSVFLQLVDEAKAIAPTLAIADIYDDQALRALTAMCFVLHRHHQGRPWPLSARKAGEAIGVSKSEAARLLKALVFVGLIRFVTPHDRLARRAAEYQWAAKEG